MRTNSPIKRLLRGNSVGALAVVLLCVSVGALALPGLFADTVQPNVTFVSAVPAKEPPYNVVVTWKGVTTGSYRGAYYKDGIMIDNWVTTDTTHTLTGLSCGARYSVKVAAIGTQGNLQSDYKSITVATGNCPGVTDFSLANAGTTVVGSWKDTSGLAQTYQVYVKTGDGPYVMKTTTATSITFTGTCGTAYSAYVVPVVGDQAGVASATASLTTANCAKV